MISPRFPRPARLAAALLLVAAPLLAGCSTDLSRAFGFSRSSPDEFAVTTQPPLSMPPDFTIRPPEPGAPRPQAVAASTAAEQALIPQSALGGGAAAASPGQQALVQSAGAAAGTASGPQIGTPGNLQDTSFARRLLFGGPATGPDDVVNAPAEAQRLRENAALGRSPVAGETPVIAPEQPSWFQRLF